jgi:AcrR family transcriptional regulator
MARPKSDIEPRILRAARDRFQSEGVDAASLRSIAHDAGTSIGMVYYYFPTKDDLFFAVVDEVYDALLRDIEAAIAPDVAVPQRLERLYGRISRLSVDELMVMRLVAREALASSERFDKLFKRFQTGHIALIARLALDGYASGTFNSKLHPVVTMLSIAGLGILPQIVRRVAGERLPFPDAPAGEDLARQLVGLTLSALKPETSA